MSNFLSLVTNQGLYILVFITNYKSQVPIFNIVFLLFCVKILDIMYSSMLCRFGKIAEHVHILNFLKISNQIKTVTLTLQQLPIKLTLILGAAWQIFPEKTLVFIITARTQIFSKKFLFPPINRQTDQCRLLGFLHWPRG